MSRSPSPPGNPGDRANDAIDLMEKALRTLASRSSVERPFTPDLAGVVAPVVDALNTVAGTFTQTARSALATTSDAGRSFIEEGLAAVGATSLLTAAIAAGQIPAGGSAIEFTDIRQASGARSIPWLEIAKEIINALLDLFPLPGKLKEIIQEILHILDKLFGGTRHELT